MPRRRKKKRNIWFNPREAYARGQPYATIARSSMGFLKRIWESDAPARRERALEIGPGNVPMVSGLGFRKCFFVEASEGVIKELKPKLQAENPEPGLDGRMIVQGLWGKTPLKKGTRFDAVVFNEALTNVAPERRRKFVAEAAEMADHVFLSDRVGVGAFFSRRGRREEKGLVSPHIMANVLVKHGFSVRVLLPLRASEPPEINKGYVDYFVILAKKSKKPGIELERHKELREFYPIIAP